MSLLLYIDVLFDRIEGKMLLDIFYGYRKDVGKSRNGGILPKLMII